MYKGLENGQLNLYIHVLILVHLKFWPLNLFFFNFISGAIAHNGRFYITIAIIESYVQVIHHYCYYATYIIMFSSYPQIRKTIHYYCYILCSVVIL